jgi:hypothetical protein
MAGHALTKLPHSDEGDLASAAVSLLDRGCTAFTMNYNYLPSYRQETFSPPFYHTTVALWLAGVGRSIEAYRLFHGVWFLLLVASWVKIVGTASATPVAVPIAAALLALNYDLINLSVSRYDIGCAALNAAAMAAYAALRRNRFSAAILLSNCFLTLSALTHPYAIFGLIGCIALALACGDWRRMRLVHAALALAPYLAGFGWWAFLIDGRWSDFIAQMLSGAQPHTVDVLSPIQVFAQDFVGRWWQSFAGWRDGVPWIMRAKTFFLPLWAVVSVVAIRRGASGTRGVRLGIVGYCAATIGIIPFSDSGHLQVYNLHAIAGFTALTAIAIADLWNELPRLRQVLLATLGAICAFGLLGIGLRVKARDLQREYVPAVELVKRALKAGDIVVAPGEFGFGLGFDEHVRVDLVLRSISTGAMPRFIVQSMENGLDRLPPVVPCAPGAVTQDSTLYVTLPLQTPRKYYQVMMRVDRGEPIADSGQRAFVISRSCNGSSQAPPRLE